MIGLVTSSELSNLSTLIISYLICSIFDSLEIEVFKVSMAYYKGVSASKA